jgi:hypothetical protein
MIATLHIINVYLCIYVYVYQSAYVCRWALARACEETFSIVNLPSNPDSGSKTAPNTGPNTGPKTAPNTGPKTALNTGPKTALNTGPKTALNTGPKTALNTGPKTALNRGNLGGLRVENKPSTCLK